MNTEKAKSIPFLTVRAGPRDGDLWITRLKEEYQALIAYVKMNKTEGNDWFKVASDATGLHWTGTCWYIFEHQRYEFKFEFDIPVGYPATPLELRLPELDGKTPKMYRGGNICLTVHFKPLWTKNVPHFGIAHALAMGLAPWLAAEVPQLVEGEKIFSTHSTVKSAKVS